MVLTFLRRLCSPTRKCRLDNYKYHWTRRNLSLSCLRASSGPPWRVLFFGTDQYALQHLKCLHQDMMDRIPSAVRSLDVTICTDKCKVREYSEENEMPIHRWPLVDIKGRYDIGVVVSFGKLIPARVIHSFPLGILNVHPSLLPEWRGSSPLISTVLSGVSTSGLTIMSIDPNRFDTGPILCQKRVNLPPGGMTSLHLADHMAQHGAPLLLNCLKNIKDIQPQPQEKASPTPVASKLTSRNMYVNWDKQCIKHVNRQYRAISELRPLKTQLGNQTVKLHGMVPQTSLNGIEKRLMKLSIAPPGSVIYDRPLEALCVKCKDGWVGFRRVTIKKSLSPLAFYNGYLANAKEPIVFTSVDNDLNYFWT